ncbi:MAG: ABC transporter ATP-binding protein [Hyphomicrobiaceae bacterium]
MQNSNPSTQSWMLRFVTRMLPAQPSSRGADIDTTIAVLTRLVKDSWRDYLGRYLIAFVFMALVAGTTALSAWIMKDVVNRIFVERNEAAMTWVPLAIFAIFIAKGAATYMQEVMLSRIGNNIIAEAQKRVYGHMLELDAEFYQLHPSNDLTLRISRGASSAREMLNLVALTLGRDLLTLIGLIGVMIAMNPSLTAIALLVGPFAAIGLRKLVRLVQEAARSEVHSLSTIIGLIRETSQGLRVVKSFQLEPVMQKRMFGAIEAVERLSNRIARTQAAINPMIETLGGLAIAMVVAYAGWRTLSYSEAPGELFAFITSLILAADPARRLSKMQLLLATHAISVRMMYDLLDVPPREREVSSNPDLVVTEGHIKFDRVSFAYKKDTPILKDVTLEALTGSVTALVGPSGGGKSTIFNLLLRLWNTSSGRITIDGQEIHKVSLASLRRNVSLVSQDVFLFEGTIRDNIAGGRDNVDLADIERAARLAHAHDFIQTFPLKYETPVGELGGQLSGGQRQRISIARAFLKNAPILLLDEPTSALDSESERAVQDSLKQLTKGRTTLVIAHRFSTIVNSDLIYVMHAGQIVESGNHATLLARDAHYTKLFDLQKADG